MSEHAILAPSSAARWVECPGSVRLCQNIDREENEDAATEGTIAHAVAAHRFKYHGWPVEPALTEEMKEAVELYVRQLLPGSVLEHRVECASIHPQVWGTADAYHLDNDAKMLRVWDFKYGYGIVEAYENKQLLCYAAGLMPPESGWRIALTIVQPRAYRRDGAIDVYTLTAAELSEHVRHIRAAAEEALGNNPRTVPGPHCHYCPAKHVCPALQKAALRETEAAGDAVPVDLTPEGLALELTLLRRAAERIGDRLAGIEAQAMSEIRAGGAVPGWLIEHNAGREKWVKPVEEVIALGELFGVSLAKPTDVVTPAQAKKAGVSAEMLEAFSKREPGSAKLVPVNPAKARKAFGG